MSEQPTAPPGWYPNQHGQTQWWDGERWGPVAPVLQHSQPAYFVQHPNAKSTGVAYCLLIFLGGFGAHRFYLGNTGRAVTMLLLLIVTFLGIGLGWDPLPQASLIALWIMQIIDLFVLAGDVRSYNARLV